MPTGVYRRPPRDTYCSVDGCEWIYLAKGLCSLHWQREKAGISFDLPYHAKDKLKKPPKLKVQRPCSKGWIRKSSGHRYVFVNGRRVSEQRAVLEELLDRRLLPTEIVHHEDESKTNNHPLNLQIVTRSQHRSIHNKLRAAKRKQ